MIHSILNLIEPPKKKKKKLLTFPISRKEKRITQIIIYLINYLSMQLRIWSREKNSKFWVNQHITLEVPVLRMDRLRVRASSILFAFCLIRNVINFHFWVHGLTSFKMLCIRQRIKITFLCHHVTSVFSILLNYRDYFDTISKV